MLQCFGCAGTGLAADEGACPYCNGKGKINDPGGPEAPARTVVAIVGGSGGLFALSTDGRLYALLSGVENGRTVHEWRELPALPQG